jgi:signal transduction histidine kinase
MQEPTNVVQRRALLIERLSWGLILLPTLTDYLEVGHLPSTHREWITELLLGALVFGYILLIRSTRRELERLDSLRQTLTLALVHDIKNPLTTIMASLSMLREKRGDEKAHDELVDMCLGGCDAQVRLIDNLLDVDRLEAGELRVSIRPVDPKDILASCLLAVQGTALLKKVKVSDLSQGSLPSLSADPDLLSRILVNLLQNALKYTLPGGVVTVSCARQDGAFLFEVTDTGEGIPPEHLGKLFGKFYRVEGTDRSARPGTGLGLHFCKLAVEAHRGTIGIRSEPGKGTTVWFSIPQPPAL